MFVMIFEKRFEFVCCIVLCAHPLCFSSLRFTRRHRSRFALRFINSRMSLRCRRARCARARVARTLHQPPLLSSAFVLRRAFPSGGRSRLTRTLFQSARCAAKIHSLTTTKKLVRYTNTEINQQQSVLCCVLCVGFCNRVYTM